jgi:hypothetical protein
VTEATSNSCHKSHFNFFYSLPQNCRTLRKDFSADNVKYITFYGAPCSKAHSPFFFDLLNLMLFHTERYECDYETCLCLLLQFLFARDCNDVFFAFERLFFIESTKMTAWRSKLIYFHSNNLQCNAKICKGWKFYQKF